MSAPRNRRIILGITLVCLSIFWRGRASAEPESERVAKLIRQLGSKDFKEREQAARDIVAIGKAAMAPLRAAAKHKDPEIGRRAEKCIADLEYNSAPATNVSRVCGT